MTKEELKKENEEKKEYLRSYLPLRNRAKRLEEEINQLRLSKMFPSTVNDGMPHGNNCSDLSAYMAILDEKVNELIQLRYEKINKYMEITRKIEMLENEIEKDLLTLKYLRGYGWEKVCIELNYEWSWVHKIHRDALKHFKVIKSA